MFENARLKLTAWYLVIIMAISLLFSFAIYSSITFEFQKFEQMEIKFQADIDHDDIAITPQEKRFYKVGHPDHEIIENSRNRLLFTLGLINFGILIMSGAAGYFLAGRTLRPIKRMVDEQKRFITDASHELRTPITSLRSEIEVAIRNNELKTSDVKKLLESNLEEVINLQILSDNLLELAQNGEKIKMQNLSDVFISQITNEAIKKVSAFAKKKEIIIENKTKDVHFKGIEDRLIEVFVILLDNSIKYNPKNSKVEVNSKILDKNLEVTVRDNGIGIEAKDLPYIFDRFYRADKSRSEISGYGLGLSIAKKIIDAHKGKITVTSKKNKGTSFKVFFRLPSDD